ncbi:DUF4440 domain-containing protein [Chryseobacterium sp. Leaf394]|uniref:YybH family protein n=1 Tax=Chryseobacterium sp. Leaf394 TaxID=1736361 RepID=UPI001F5275F4
MVRKYFKYLYDADTDSILNLYTENAVLMPADIPSTEGVAEFRQAYNDTFEAVDFIDASTNYDEISVYDEIAIVRTTSQSHLFLKNEKTDIKNKMREFFILNKVGEVWKISRYMFNKEL